MDITEIPTELVGYIAKLRQEAARYRSQRNAARREADSLRAELSALKHTAAHVN